MPYTSLPRAVAQFASTIHTELVAVVGELEKERDVVARATGDQLYFAPIQRAARDTQTSFTWTWGQAQAALTAKHKGHLFAVRDDGLRVALAAGSGRQLSFQFLVCRGAKVLQKFKGPDFGMYYPRGEFVHDRLCLAASDGVVIMDVDAGKKLTTLGAEYFASAPRRRIAIAGEGHLSICDIDSGAVRTKVDLPPDVELRHLTVSPSGTLLAASGLGLGKGLGYGVYDLEKRKMVTAIAGDRFLGCPQFVANGRILVTLSGERTMRLWEVGSWRLLESVKIRGYGNQAPWIGAWDEHQAMVVTTSSGVVYVFQIRETTSLSASVKRPVDRPKPAALPKRSAKPRQLAPLEWPKQGFPFKLTRLDGEAQGAIDMFGGVPAGFDKDNWPRCRQCEDPMPAVVTLRAHEGRLPLREHAALVLFVCGTCQSDEMESGASAVELVSSDQLSRTVRRPPRGLASATGVLRRRGLTFADAPEPGGRRPRVALDKVGGKPVWIQGDETPKCRQCKTQMRFVAQLADQLDPKLNFGGGIGYLFVCRHEHEGHFLWQC